MSEKERTEFQIHKANLPKLQKRVDRLARKAEKYGLPVPSFEGRATGRKIPMLEVAIHGETPVLEGDWRLVSVIDHRVVPHEELGWPIHTLPNWNGLECPICEGRGEIDDDLDETNKEKVICFECLGDGRVARQVPKEFHTEPPWCEHCELVRDRAETFVIVRYDCGVVWRRVGRQCLSDYTRGVPLHAYAAYLYDLPQLAFGLDEDEGGRGRRYLDTETYLTHVVAVIERYGWRSRAAARDSFQGPPATADTALDHLHDNEDVDDHHREWAKAALDWARDELANGDDLSEYDYNLVIAASQQATDERKIGLVASLPQAHQRYILEQRLADESNSTHQGEVGERLELTLTVTKRLDIEIDAYHGRGGEVLKVHVMQDGNGNVYVWKTTSKKLAEHETYRLRGTVKSHDDYKGIPQTTLTRCAKIVHDPCGEYENWFDDAGWHCAACDQLEVGNG
jgi:hypothetical protein